MHVRRFCALAEYVPLKLQHYTQAQATTMPVMVLWGEKGSLAGRAAVELWRPWAERVEGETLPCGHFLPEEHPQAVISHFRRFFGAQNAH